MFSKDELKEEIESLKIISAVADGCLNLRRDLVEKHRETVKKLLNKLERLYTTMTSDNSI